MSRAPAGSTPSKSPSTAPRPPARVTCTRRWHHAPLRSRHRPLGVAGLQTLVLARQRSQKSHDQRGKRRRLRQQTGEAGDFARQQRVGPSGVVGDVQANAHHRGFGREPVDQDSGQLTAPDEDVVGPSQPRVRDAEAAHDAQHGPAGGKWQKRPRAAPPGAGTTARATTRLHRKPSSGRRAPGPPSAQPPAPRSMAENARRANSSRSPPGVG